MYASPFLTIWSHQPVWLAAEACQVDADAEGSLGAENPLLPAGLKRQHEAGEPFSYQLRDSHWLAGLKDHHQYGVV